MSGAVIKTVGSVIHNHSVILNPWDVSQKVKLLLCDQSDWMTMYGQSASG